MATADSAAREGERWRVAGGAFRACTAAFGFTCTRIWADLRPSQLVGVQSGLWRPQSARWQLLEQ